MPCAMWLVSEINKMSLPPFLSDFYVDQPRGSVSGPLQNGHFPAAATLAPGGVLWYYHPKNPPPLGVENAQPTHNTPQGVRPSVGKKHWLQLNNEMSCSNSSHFSEEKSKTTKNWIKKGKEQARRCSANCWRPTKTDLDNFIHRFCWCNILSRCLEFCLDLSGFANEGACFAPWKSIFPIITLITPDGITGTSVTVSNKGLWTRQPVRGRSDSDLLSDLWFKIHSFGKIKKCGGDTHKKEILPK